MKLTFTFLLFLFFLALAPISLSGQKLLQIEKSGTLKTERFYIGDEVTFQLADDDGWYTRTIQDINVEANMLIFPKGSVNINDIQKVRTFKNRNWSRALNINALYGSASFVVLSLLGTLADVALTMATLTIPASTIIVTSVIRFVFRHKTHRMGKRKRLRVLDLTFYEVKGP